MVKRNEFSDSPVWRKASSPSSSVTDEVFEGYARSTYCCTYFPTSEMDSTTAEMTRVRFFVCQDHECDALDSTVPRRKRETL